MARRRILVRDIAEILEHWQAGRSICAISRSLGVCRVTIRKYVYAVEARGYHQGDPTPPQGWKAFITEAIPKPPDPSTRSETFAKLLPYQDEIRIALATTKAATIWQRLRDDKNVKVSKPSFYRYLSCFLSDVWKKSNITVRRDDPPPGEEVQIDFGYLGTWLDTKTGKKCRLWAFAMILSFSRHMFVRVVNRMDQREWLTCHILAFEFFGGAPIRIVPDNLKTGILKADLYDPQFNQGYEELAHHYGVIIDPARSGKPKDKPRVERMIPYIRDSFWSGREFSSQEEINRQATEWCLRIAGVREHGTTHREPLSLFRLAEEKEQLAGLSPGKRYFLEQKIKGTVDKDVAMWLKKMERDILNVAREAAAGFSECRLQSQDVTGRDEEMFFHGALLMPERSMAALEGMTDEWNKRHEAQGLSVELSGPWPPYHFAPVL